MSRSLLLVFVTTMATIPLPSNASTFHDIGTFTNSGLFGAPPISSPLDMASDGTIVGFDTTLPSVSWLWTPVDGFEQLPNPEGLNIFYPEVVSDDASKIVGHGGDEALYIWSREDGYQQLDLPNDAENARPIHISNSGHVVGSFRTGDTRLMASWSGEGFEIIEEMDADRHVTAISDDLSVALAHDGESSESFVWHRGSGFQDAPLVGRDLSADGETLVGGDGNQVAARWNAGTGLTRLGNLPDYAFTYADSVSSDGTVIVGWAYNTNENGAELEATPFVWDPMNGIRDLATVLESEFSLSNVEIGSTRPVSVTGRSIFISDDLRTIAGARILPNPKGKHQEIWAVTLDRPIAITSGVSGDFNNNGVLDAEDIDLLSDELHAQRNVALFDVNDDGSVNSSDREFWIHNLANTYLGDANLDGEFNSGDMVDVFLAGEYEDNVTGNSGWAEGDWNADGDFTSSDLTAAFLDGGYELGPRPPANAVPEPTASSLLGAILIACAGLAIRRGHS